MSLSMRIATPEDAPAVDALLKRSYGRLLREDYPAEILIMALPLMGRSNPKLLASGTYFLVADEAGELIGAGGWTATAPGDMPDTPGLGHIRHVATDDRAVRRGVGRMILQRCFGEAKAAGLARLEALSTLTAVPFYEAMGFVDIEPVAVPMGPDVMLPSIRMLREL
jgi:N-acetylglutamate synthase-like GNAT family acetyltransferase